MDRCGLGWYMGAMKSTAFAALAIALTAGCAAQSAVDPSEEDVTTEDGALSEFSRSFVALRPDLRQCMSPYCGGFWVHDVNRATLNEIYVSDLDFSASGLSEEDQGRARDGSTDELILRGKLGKIDPKTRTRAFVVSEAYRGMPGVKVADGETFYKTTLRDPQITCFTAPCNNEVATKLNSSTTTSVTTLSVKRASKPLVDQAWLAQRVLGHDAIVSAKIVNGAKLPGGYEKVVDASQVFVKLPEHAGPCPMFKLMACPAGLERTYTRSPDRCLLPSECVKPGLCAAYLPACEEGYTLASWTGSKFACNAYACDPSFAN